MKSGRRKPVGEKAEGDADVEVRTTALDTSGYDAKFNPFKATVQGKKIIVWTVRAATVTRLHLYTFGLSI